MRRHKSEDKQSAISYQRSASRILHSALRNEKGIALAMVLILSTIALAIMSGLVYMLTSGTQVSGIQKRYKTALEAGKGGGDIAYQIIGAQNADTTAIAARFAAITNFTVTATPTCMNSKLLTSTGNWGTCSSSLTIDPNTSTTYDFRFDLGTSPDPVYRVYAKIVDTVLGNSAADEGLLKSGVVTSASGEVKVQSVPYLYTMEVNAQNRDNPDERAKLSILYQY